MSGANARALRAGLGAAIVLAAACVADAPSRLVVVVDSDITAGTDLDAVRAVVRDSQGAEQSSHEFPIAPRATATPPRVALPFSFVVVPAGSDARRRVAIEVEALGPSGRSLFTRRAVTGFVAGKTLRLPMFLARQCSAATCPRGQTCTEAGCASDGVVAGSLHEVRPGEELATEDAAPRDAGGGADGPQDSATDAPREAGADASADGGRDAGTDSAIADAGTDGGSCDGVCCFFDIFACNDPFCAMLSGGVDAGFPLCCSCGGLGELCCACAQPCQGTLACRRRDGGLRTCEP